MASVEAPARIFQSMIDPCSWRAVICPILSKVCRSRFVPGSPCLKLFEANVFDCRFCALIIRAAPGVAKKAPRSLLPRYCRLLQARHIACIVVECVEKATDNRPARSFLLPRWRHLILPVAGPA